MTKQTWDQHSIKGELHRRGMTLAALAELHGMTPGQVSHVWTRPVRKAERAIADFLDIPVEELFPDRYPIRRSRILSSTNEALVKRQKAARSADRKAA